MPETLWCNKVKEFGPLIVSIDAQGRNLFEENKVIFNERKEAAKQLSIRKLSSLNKEDSKTPIEVSRLCEDIYISRRDGKEKRSDRRNLPCQ